MTMLLTLLLTAAALAAAVWFCLSFWKRADRGSSAAIPLTLAAALLLYWLAETGIQRRVFGLVELFRFAADGAAQPGKAAVLLLCLLICLFLGLTPPGARLRARLNALGQKNGALWLISLAATALFFLWANRITVLRFMTNDDTGLLRTFARIPQNGLYSAWGSFCSILFAALLGLFYSIDPEGWWYAGYHLLALFVSCAVIGRCILLKTRRHGWSPLWGCLILWIACCGAILPALAELSFTVTPAVVGTAAVALLFCRDENVSRGGRIASDAGCVILTLLCYLHRPVTGRALLCFLALAGAYQIVKLLLAGREGRRQLIGLGVTAASLLLLFAACDRATNAIARSADTDETAYDRQDFSNAEYYRSVVMDYLNGQLTAEQLEAVGIPVELANLLFKQWYFMDERINTDTFRQLAELYYHPSAGGGDTASGLLEILRTSYKDEPTYLPSMYSMAAVLGALALLSTACFVRYGRRYWLDFLCGLGALGGGAILCLYLIWNGRFLFRVFLVVAIPAIVLLLLSCLSVPEGSQPQRSRRSAVTAAVSGCLIAALCVLCGVVTYHVPYATEYADREIVFAEQRQTEKYAAEHPDVHFITNFTALNLDPFHGGSYPSNMGLWGGVGVTALDDGYRLYADDFFRDNIRFMCQMPGSVLLLLQYLTLDHGPVAALDEAHLTDNIYVYDLRQLTPGESYTGWYDWNGQQYYFEDGRALSGVQRIDGEEYSFAEPGARSFMLQLEADGARYYVTTAYTLSAEP